MPDFISKFADEKSLEFNNLEALVDADSEMQQEHSRRVDEITLLRQQYDIAFSNFPYLPTFPLSDQLQDGCITLGLIEEIKSVVINAESAFHKCKEGLNQCVQEIVLLWNDLETPLVERFDLDFTSVNSDLLVQVH